MKPNFVCDKGNLLPVNDEQRFRTSHPEDFLFIQLTDMKNRIISGNGYRKGFYMKREKRDIEKSYPVNQFVQKLRRLADAIENGKRFQIQIAGERISVPSDAVFNIEHERGKTEEEIEFQLKWKLN